MNAALAKRQIALLLRDLSLTLSTYGSVFPALADMPATEDMSQEAMDRREVALGWVLLKLKEVRAEPPSPRLDDAFVRGHGVLGDRKPAGTLIPVFMTDDERALLAKTFDLLDKAMG